MTDCKYREYLVLLTQEVSKSGILIDVITQAEVAMRVIPQYETQASRYTIVVYNGYSGKKYISD